ncbi:MAG: hypothetical protein ACOH1T_03370 [Microbacteriaceae bacterium]
MSFCDEVDEDTIVPDLEAFPAPVSSVAHISHAAAREPLVPGHPAKSGSEHSDDDVEVSHLYRRH